MIYGEYFPVPEQTGYRVGISGRVLGQAATAYVDVVSNGGGQFGDTTLYAGGFRQDVGSFCQEFTSSLLANGASSHFNEVRVSWQAGGQLIIDNITVTDAGHGACN